MRPASSMRRGPSGILPWSQEAAVEVVVQVNGKTRSKVTVPRDATEEAVVAAARADDNVRRFPADKPFRKVVYVQNRLVNLVI